MVASKLFSDVFFTNTRYAKVGGLPVSELNILELEFLALNNFSLFITIEELQQYGNQLLAHWKSENEDIQPCIEDEDIAPPIRRRARHLSVDKHEEDNKRSA
ncbi:hypothetical protein G6F57_000980 [Rhizopus arrhizus]|nr:hypothetical protein G6F23_000987 [Rhizopus arrhizus]KAG1423211.1 hypothetical protein G6F58_002909 [Rhizopus delemar]KAG0765614.1 hypothetical protein G6F24_004279 [Rhizopus arrhizus]KAG0911939.1 hypothetical protein G6F33_006541 [Rhizopus arrhizus]KAG0943990.1 hypothetical protein G6F30_004968 [Rhizopus arrhizus]